MGQPVGDRIAVVRQLQLDADLVLPALAGYGLGRVNQKLGLAAGDQPPDTETRR